jgi:lysozyme family protein
MSQPADPIQIDDEILVSFPRRYVRAFFPLLGIEGGWVDDPVDRGGATKWGISLRFLVAAGQIDRDEDGYADFDLDFDGDIDADDIRKLTVEHAFFLYHEHFWKPLDAGSFPEPIGEMLFDQGVNGGNRAARKLLQQAINEGLEDVGERLILVDGQIGPVTRKMMRIVIDVLGVDHLAEDFREVVRARYRAIVRRNPSQRRFLRGWLNRADQLGRH